MAKKVLIIEDEYDILENLGSILEFNNFEAILAKDGEDGLLKALKEIPDIIICDVMMPKKDGYEVLTEIRKSQILSNTPFIFLTAKSDKPDKRKGMNNGADDYITKPFKTNELIEAINARLERKSINNKAVEIQIQRIEEKINKITSHEVYNPLNVILGYSEIISNYFDDLSKKEILEFARFISDAGNNLNKTFKKRILFSDLQYLEYNNFNIEKQEILFDKKFIESIVMKCALEHNRENDIEIDIEDFNLFTSLELLSNAILEIFENAIKFSVTDSLIKIYAYNFENKHLLIIEDNGIGFKEEDINQVQPFSKFNTDLISSEGSGLGLYIAKTIFEKLLNAEFKIESVLNEFTRIIVKLP